MNEIRKNILRIVNENIADNEISADQDELDLSQLGMDSITFIRIVVVLEETFNIELPDESLLLTEMNSINKIVNVVTTALESVNE